MSQDSSFETPAEVSEDAVDAPTTARRYPARRRGPPVRDLTPSPVSSPASSSPSSPASNPAASEDPGADFEPATTTGAQGSHLPDAASFRGVQNFTVYKSRFCIFRLVMAVFTCQFPVRTQ